MENEIGFVAQAEGTGKAELPAKALSIPPIGPTTAPGGRIVPPDDTVGVDRTESPIDGRDASGFGVTPDRGVDLVVELEGE